jgi:hypothetical protein
MLQNPELFYKMNKMNLREHRDILNQDLEKGKSQEHISASQIPPHYYKKIKIYKMNLYVTLKSDYFYGLAVF